jgi:hypothetical protein
MADLSDVETTLVSLIGAALYPAGVPTGNISPVAGKPVRVFRDWPLKPNLDTDLAAGVLNVSVYANPNMTRKDTRYPRRWQSIGPMVQPTITWVVSGGMATLGGTVTVPQNVALIVDGQDVVYAVQPDDTLATIAAALATALNLFGAGTVTPNGPALTIVGSHSIIGRVGAVQPMSREIRRQEQGFQITAWCPDPDSRDAVCVAIDAALAPLNFITLSDGSAARITYRSTASSDKAENEDLFRRDLIFTVEYATTQLSTAPQAVVIRKTVQGGQQPIATMVDGDPPVVGGVFAVQLDGDGNPILDGEGHYVIGGNAGPLLTELES